MGQEAAATERTQTNGNGASQTGPSPSVIKSYAPATGEVLGEVPVMTDGEVRAVVARARAAQKAWGALPLEERCEAVLRYKDAIVERSDEIVDLLARECGKPRHEALAHEVLVVADIAAYFAKAAPHVLAPREVPLHLMKHRKSVLHYVPRGVVAVISPWNFPFQLPLRDMLLAVLAGNSCVLKPSEITPLIAVKAKQIWDEAGLPPDVFQVVTGYGAAGASLIDSGIQFCVLTGSVATGKRVAAACGERLIPCVMELGGKAPFIACADIDIDRTARGLVYGAFANGGQVCISVERVYAHQEVHDRLLSRVVELTRELKMGDPATEWVDVGAMIFPKQMDIADEHIQDAVAKGARVEVGGKRRPGPGQFFEPTVISGCNHSMSVMTGEIFGPVVPFMSVASDEEAIALANESHLGLNAYVFSGDRGHGRRVAERVEAGSVVVNDVLVNGAMPEVPFGGIKQSGFGRVMSDESLREMCDVRHVNMDRMNSPADPFWFPYTEKSYGRFRKGLKVLFGGGTWTDRIKALF